MQAEGIVETVFASIRNAVLKGEKVNIAGFGIFTKKAVKGRNGRNPKTGRASRYSLAMGSFHSCKVVQRSLSITNNFMNTETFDFGNALIALKMVARCQEWVGMVKDFYYPPST